MKEEIWNSGAPVRKEDRDNEKWSAQEAARERATDLYTRGAIVDSQFDSEAGPFEFSFGDTDLEIDVGSGVAYSGHDATTDRPESIDASDASKLGGERIIIPAADVAGGQDYRNDAGLKTGTFKETSDGLGGFTSTPESTLTQNVPLTAASTNWIWLGYLKTIDSAVTVNHKVSPKILYPFANDGYKILVTTSASAPSPDMILLGTAVAAGGAPVFDQSAMPISRVRSKRTNVALSDDLKPAAYVIPGTGFESTVSLEDHVNAQGTHTGATPENPHNTSLEDMGISFADVDLVTHRDKQHTKGQTGDSVTTLSGLYPLTDSSSPVGGDDAIMYLQKLIPGEEVIIAGKRYTEVWPKLPGAPGAGDAYISFGPIIDGNTNPTVNPYKPAVNDAVGNYTIILEDDGAGNLTAKSLVGTVLGNDNQLVVAHVTWNGGAITVLNDVRVFGQTGTKDIQTDSITTDKILNSAVTVDKVSFNYANSDAKAGEALAIKDNTISTAKIQDDAVDAAKIADDAVFSQNIIIADATDPADPNTGQGIATAHIRDNAVTAAKISPQGLLKWVKVTKIWSDFSASVTQRRVVLIPSAVATVVHSVLIKHSSQFTGAPAVTNPQVSVGILGEETMFASAFSVGTIASNVNFQISNSVNAGSLGSVNIEAVLTRDAGDLNNLIAGSVSFHLLISELPNPL